MMALKCRIKAWNIWRKHYIGFTWTYGILVFLGIVHSPTFALEYDMTRYKQERGIHDL